MNRLINLATANLGEINSLIAGLSEDQYTRNMELLDNGSIGQHVRHILEFYQCLVASRESGVVNYDARKRDLFIETSITAARQVLRAVSEELGAIKSDFPVMLVADYSIDKEQQQEMIASSYHRELAYNFEHSIHHQALIKVAVLEMKITTLVKGTFGYAPSTIRNKQCVQ